MEGRGVYEVGIFSRFSYYRQIVGLFACPSAVYSICNYRATAIAAIYYSIHCLTENKVVTMVKITGFTTRDVRFPVSP